MRLLKTVMGDVMSTLGKLKAESAQKYMDREESEKQLWEALAAGWPACFCLLAIAGQLGWLAGAQDFGMPENGS